MTDIMKLAQEYAVRYRVNRAVDEARAALQSAIEALQAENSQLRTDLNAELQGNAAMRMRLGAKDGETMIAFAERLASQLDAMGKGEPVAHCRMSPLRSDEFTRRAVVQWVKEPVEGPLYAAPKALEPQPDDSDVNQVHESNAQVTYAPIFYGASAPKAMAPLTQTEVVDAFCNKRHNTQYVSVFDAGVRFAEKHHGIGGTP